MDLGAIRKRFKLLDALEANCLVVKYAGSLFLSASLFDDPFSAVLFLYN
jgi:hypothetical protein